MKVVSRIILVVLIAAIVLVGGSVAWFYSGIGLKKLSALKEYKAEQNSKIYASDGTLLTELRGDQNREVVDLDKMPMGLRNGVIAIEDENYYKHGGIDWKSVFRAFYANVVQGGVVQGGSTITQQYVKNVYVGAKRNLWRKIEEAHLAYELSKKYSKDKILELYLNDVNFGQACYGVFTAARKYFGKLPQDLSLAECAMMAGVLRAPGYYDPYKQPQAVIARRNLVLQKMKEQRYINAAECSAAQAEPLKLEDPNKVYEPPPAPYFCDYITKLIRANPKYGDQQAFRGGLRIYTTIDMHLQGLAEETVRSMTRAGGPDAALCCVDPKTGYIKAMVGGRDFTASQYNVAAEGHRQAGSSFKVFVLTRALADGVSQDNTYDSSSPRTIKLPDGGKWTVKNYDGKGSGTMTIRDATIHSVNVVFAQLIMDVGASRVADMAKQMGIRSAVEPNPAIALGGLEQGVNPLDMATAFGTLANNGQHAVPRSIYKITDADGNVLEENKPEVHPVLDPKVVAKVNDILSAVVSSGTATGARIGRPQAGKTGTTEDQADAWFVGYTPDLVTAVWVGYPQARISTGQTGGGLPASIWRAFMSQALQDVPPSQFGEGVGQTGDQQQSEMVTVTLCDDSGLLAGANCPHTHQQEFNRGDEPTQFCNIHKSGAQTQIPSVVGMSQSGATSELRGAGYKVSVVQQASRDSAAGTVISQTPAAGTQLAAGGTVTISVSSGAASAAVPGVVGMPEGTATSVLSAAGFSARVSYVQSSPAGVVLSQSPSEGTQMPTGSSVSLTVSRSGGGGFLEGIIPLF